MIQKVILIIVMACFFSPINALEEAISLNESSIPIVDMNDLHSPDPSQRAKFIEGISKALHELGFFGVINCGINQSVIDQGYLSAKHFFELPAFEKQKVDGASVGYQRGCRPLLSNETAKGFSVPDFKEFYHVGRELSDDDLKFFGYPKNIWPDAIDFKSPALAVFDELEKCSTPILEAIAESLDLPKDYITKTTKKGEALLRILHYPLREDQPKGAVWAGEHTDITTGTILPPATANGLEVKGRGGEWIRVQVPQGAIIYNCGDYVENLTNGYYRSAPHRVIASNDNTGEDRYSMVFFIHAQNDTDLSPLSQCIAKTGGVQKYAPVVRQELLLERIADLGAAPAYLLESLAESGAMERLIQYNRASMDAMKALQQADLASPVVLEEIQRREAGQ